MEQQTPEEYFGSDYRDTVDKLTRHIFFKAPGLAEAEDITAAVYTDFYQ